MSDNNKVVGYSIAAIILCTVVANMFVSKRMKSYSKLRFFSERPAGESPFDVFNRPKPKSTSASGEKGTSSPGDQTFNSQTHTSHIYTHVPSVPATLNQLLVDLELKPNPQTFPSSKELKAGYRQFAQKYHPDKVNVNPAVSKTVSSSHFRDVTLEYKRILSTIEEIEKSTSAAAKH